MTNHGWSEKKRPFKELSKLWPCPLTMPSHTVMERSVPVLSCHFADLMWLRNAAIPCGTHQCSLFMWSLKLLKKKNDTKVVGGYWNDSEDPAGSLWRERDFREEADPCQEEGNTCKIDHNSISPLIATKDKIIKRHLHIRIGHYLESTSVHQNSLPAHGVWHMFHCH